MDPALASKEQMIERMYQNQPSGDWKAGGQLAGEQTAIQSSAIIRIAEL
jgi:hypothetical protein